MPTLEPPTKGVATPPAQDFRMYLQGNEDGEVEIICTGRSCMRKGEATSYNPDGLWLQDVGNLPYEPTPRQVQEAWSRHLVDMHGVWA